MATTRREKFDDATLFLEAIRPASEGREAELNLMLGLAERLRRDPSSGVLFAALLHGSRPAAAALREPPHGLVVAEWADGAATDLAAWLAEDEAHHNAPEIVGTASAARQFAERWSVLTGRSASLGMSQRILELTEVRPPTDPPPGVLRAASTGDTTLVSRWLGAFEAAAMGSESSPPNEQRAHARTRIESGRLFLWETAEGPKSMAALARPTGRGVTVNAVYTPEPHRGRGYASAAVAALSQHALDTGYEFCCLYTNASNPTSNRIYERIGYRFVCEAEVWRLSPGGACPDGEGARHRGHRRGL